MEPDQQQIQTAFRQHDQEATILINIKVGCVLGMLLVPSFAMLDENVYPQFVREFLLVRLLCSALIGFCLLLVTRGVGKNHYYAWGIILLLLPSSAISYMIWRSTGAESPYYAGLNLVLLVLGFVLRWTFTESFVAVVIVALEYVAACRLHGPFELKGVVINNFYFLIATGIIVVTGNRIFSQARFREFVARHQLAESKRELEANKRELEESNRKLIELDQLKSRFFANVSHELRTPLTLLLAPLETLIRKYRGTLDPAGQDLLATMQNSGMRLLKLINDLLDLIRLESGRLQVRNEPVALPEFVNGLVSAVRQLAANKRITLEIQISPELATVMGDRDKLEKILLNLLFNALKFTPADGRVRLRVEKQKEALVFIVSDTGVGIAAKNLPYVFDRFWQEDGSSRRKFQGLGIGLALVKELTEIQGGTASVQSQEGQGATFTIRLPCCSAPPAPPAAEPAAAEDSVTGEEWLVNLYHRAELFPVIAARRAAVPAAPAAPHGRRAVVLVADDEADMRRFLAAQLAGDYQIIEAVDGRDALDQAMAHLPDLILLDLMMPHLDGLQVCRELRACPPAASIPIILLTARADEEAKFDALQMGANDFLAKPFSSVELQARVKNLIERHRDQHRLARQNEALSGALEQIKQTELQLVQSEKLSSLGRLSAGIIHEINNPLNYSLTGLFALRHKGKQLPEEQQAEFEAIINDVEEGLKRVRNIVSDLRTFTHPGGGGAEGVAAAAAAGAALRFLAGEWKDRVGIHQDIPPEQQLWVNRNNLVHVLVNLLQNAIDALLEKTFPPGEQPQIWLAARTEGSRCLLTIRDNGPGIDPRHAGKIFDPFFTTKDVGKGMGLGLSICYRIVQDSGGKISFRSEPGKSCEFTLDLPATQEAASQATPYHAELVRP